MFTGAGKQLVTSSITVVFPVMTIIIILQNEFVLPEQYFYRVLNTHRAEERKLA